MNSQHSYKPFSAKSGVGIHKVRSYHIYITFSYFDNLDQSMVQLWAALFFLTLYSKMLSPPLLRIPTHCLRNTTELLAVQAFQEICCGHYHMLELTMLEIKFCRRVISHFLLIWGTMKSYWQNVIQMSCFRQLMKRIPLISRCHLINMSWHNYFISDINDRYINCQKFRTFQTSGIFLSEIWNWDL